MAVPPLRLCWARAGAIGAMARLAASVRQSSAPPLKEVVESSRERPQKVPNEISGAAKRLNGVTPANSNPPASGTGDTRQGCSVSQVRSVRYSIFATIARSFFAAHFKRQRDQSGKKADIHRGRQSRAAAPARETLRAWLFRLEKISAINAWHPLRHASASACMTLTSANLKRRTRARPLRVLSLNRHAVNSGDRSPFLWFSCGPSLSACRK